MAKMRSDLMQKMGDQPNKEFKRSVGEYREVLIQADVDYRN